MIITSPQNPKIKQILRLKNKRFRNKTKLFLIEGEREITRAITCGLTPHSLFESTENKIFLLDIHKKNNCIDQPKFPSSIEEGQGSPEEASRGGILPNQKTSLNFPPNIRGTGSVALQRGIITYTLPPQLFQKISYRQNPTGHLAIFHQPDTDINNIKLDKKSIILVLESPEKPGNVGAILRTADATLIDAIIITDPNLDIFNPNVIRSAAGTLFSRPVYISNNQTTLKILQKNNIKIICTTPQADKYYHQLKYQKPLAIVMGPEDIGLSPIWLKNANQTIKIPMHGIADSLNLSVSTAVILYEVIYQQKKS